MFVFNRTVHYISVYILFCHLFKSSILWGFILYVVVIKKIGWKFFWILTINVRYIQNRVQGYPRDEDVHFTIDVFILKIVLLFLCTHIFILKNERENLLQFNPTKILSRNLITSSRKSSQILKDMIRNLVFQF